MLPRVLSFFVAVLAVLTLSSPSAAQEISACGAVIDAPGAYYLSADLFQPYSYDAGLCINISASNVLLDGRGHSITCDREAAIYATGGNVTIRNLSVYGCGFNEVSPAGVALSGSASALSVSRLVNSTLTLGGNGTVLTDSELIDTPLNVVVDDYLYPYSTITGVRVLNNTIRETWIFNGTSFLPDPLPPPWLGLIALSYVRDSVVSGNTVECTSAVPGISIEASSGVEVSNNTISGCYVGIVVVAEAPSSNNLIAGNVIFATGGGILMRWEDANVVRGNTINASLGIGLMESWNNTIAGNLIWGVTGIALSYSDGNLIYGNLFNTSGEGAWVSNSSSIWNTSTGGNYWGTPSGDGYSDVCGDANGDSICDAPYVIDASNIDYQPLASPPVAMPEFPAGGTLALLSSAALLGMLRRRSFLLRG